MKVYKKKRLVWRRDPSEGTNAVRAIDRHQMQNRRSYEGNPQPIVHLRPVVSGVIITWRNGTKVEKGDMTLAEAKVWVEQNLTDYIMGERAVRLQKETQERWVATAYEAVSSAARELREKVTALCRAVGKETLPDNIMDFVTAAHGAATSLRETEIRKLMVDHMTTQPDLSLLARERYMSVYV